jgi:hypothetical protein
MTIPVRLGPLVVVGALLVACSSESKPTANNDAPRGDGPERNAAEGEVIEGTDPKTTLAAPVGEAPLVNGQPSLEALGKAVVAALEAKDGRALMGLAVSQPEFEHRLFGALVSDPDMRRHGAAPAWKNLSSESLIAMGNALSKHGGKGLAFVSLESTARDERPGLVVHAAPKLTVQDPTGTALELPILGQVLEHPASGTFLVLSFAD